jgi:hypothetical protein
MRLLASDSPLVTLRLLVTASVIIVVAVVVVVTLAHPVASITGNDQDSTTVLKRNHAELLNHTFLFVVGAPHSGLMGSNKNNSKSNLHS